MVSPFDLNVPKAKREYVRLRHGKRWHIPNKENMGTACGLWFEWGNMSGVQKADKLPSPFCYSCFKYERDGFPVVEILKYRAVRREEWVGR